NGGGGTLSGLSVTTTIGTENWLTATLEGATAPTTLRIQLHTGSLPAGTRSAAVTVKTSTTGVLEKSITVSFVITAAPTPTIGLSSTSGSFQATAGGSSPAPQTVNVTNAGSGTLSGLEATITYASSQTSAWLSALLSQTTAPATLTLRATTGSL